MARTTLLDKLAILSDAAKYDASCASSGSVKRNSLKSGGIGSTEGSGICHAYAPDGRCISLLKILLTNFCIYDCAYCINRVSSNVERARFDVDEVVETLVLDPARRLVLVRVDDEERLILLGEGRELIEPRQIGGGQVGGGQIGGGK